MRLLPAPGDPANRQEVRRGVLHGRTPGGRADRGGKPLLRSGDVHEADRS